ncbi:MAG: isopeptide-forming domain-containing fimbrial protein [Oscillospiraceae bacterium]|nr:isopeptide-forming domain-containing fimbrial protein [Oscillospiraceae bacterium]
MNNYITNSADINYNYALGDESVASDALSNTSVTEVTAPNVSIYKEACVSNVKAGDTIAYSVTAINSGNATTPENVTITDTLPASVTLVTGSVSVSVRDSATNTETELIVVADVANIDATHYYNDTANPITVTMVPLEAGKSYILRFSVTVNGTVDDPNGGETGPIYPFADVLNTAAVSYSTTTQTTPLDSNTVTVTSDYAYITVGHTAAASVSCGGNPNYQLTVTNYGNVDATGVVVTDNLPKGFTFATGTIADHIEIYDGATEITDTHLQTAALDTTKATTNTVGLLTITFVPTATIPKVEIVGDDTTYTIKPYTIKILGTISC